MNSSEKTRITVKIRKVKDWPNASISKANKKVTIQFKVKLNVLARAIALAFTSNGKISLIISTETGAKEI